MCFHVCCFDLIIPYIWIPLLMLTGVIGGKRSLLQFSLFLQLLTFLHAFLKNFLSLTVSEVPLVFLLLILSICVPSTFIPEILIWIYSKLLSISEILCLLVEVIGILDFTIQISKILVDRRDDQPELSKSFEWSVVSILYGSSTYILFLVTQECYSYLFIALATMVLLLAAITVATLLLSTGVMLNAATVTFCTLAVFYGLQQDLHLVDNKLELPDSWKGFVETNSLGSVIYSLLVSQIDQVNLILELLSHVFTLWFVISIVMRIFSVTCIINLIKRYLLDEEEETSKDEDSPLTSPYLLKAVGIFVFTQFMFHHIGHDNINNTTVNIAYYVCCRLLQIITINGLYVYYMITEENEHCF